MTRPLLVLAAAASLVFPAAAPAAPVPLDTVSATGNSAFIPPQPGIPALQFRDIQISAQSGTSGENATGAASFTFGPFNLSGSVTCLRVTGPNSGAGTAAAPTTAVLNFVNQTSGPFTGRTVTVQLVDKGGNGQDTFSATVDTLQPRDPADCTTPFTPDPRSTAPLTDGRAIVFDAPPLPTTKDQCKNGGWRNYPGFKNQGDCVSFVATGGKNPPG